MTWSVRELVRNTGGFSTLQKDAEVAKLSDRYVDAKEYYGPEWPMLVKEELRAGLHAALTSSLADAPRRWFLPAQTSLRSKKSPEATIKVAWDQENLTPGSCVLVTLVVSAPSQQVPSQLFP